jgi:NAD(P)-dependent dehydrogenase (short-subunit alcohol dehydrogenase family)
MAKIPFESALIVGAGPGLGAALATALAGEGIKVAVAARKLATLDALATATGARSFACDATVPADVAGLFAALDAEGGAPDIVIYNASYRTRGAFVDLDPVEVQKTIQVSAYAAFLVGQQAARRMLPKRRGAILFTGASAGVKGYAQSAPFAMGKFALRGLAQSMARELHPQGIHVAHVVVDGGIRSAHRPPSPERPDALLDPAAIAASYLYLLQQPRNAWTAELELRPWVETF